MASAVFVLDQPAALTVFLRDTTTEAGAAGLVFSDVTCDFRVTGAATFSVLTLDGTNFTEIGSGWYEIAFEASDIDTTGNMVVRVDGSTIDMTVVTAYVTEEAPAPQQPITPPSTVAIFGWVYDGQGEPVSDAGVGARLIAAPAVLANSSVVTSGLVSTRTDSSGFFSLNLVVGTQFDIFISDANYRRIITVPVASANLFDIA